jgi:uncharacterized membrane protein YgcG
MSLLDGIRHLFSHDDQCEIHATFQPECEACQLRLLQRQASFDTSPNLFTDTVDTNSAYDASADTGSSIDTGGGDFGGFDGGDSGGGGSSGDF